MLQKSLSGHVVTCRTYIYDESCRTNRQKLSHFIVICPKSSIGQII